jgi:hypothetical protein
MKVISKLAVLGAFCLVAAALSSPAQAACVVSYGINQLAVPYTYVVTPGTGALEGNFWALGFGDPDNVPTPGSDSGTVPASDWVSGPPPNGQYLNGSWSTPGHDGCVQDPPVTQPAETVVALHDASADGTQAYYAVACVEEDAGGDFNYNTGLGGVNINLAPMPKPVIVTASSGAGTATVTLNIEAIGAGVYRGAGECSSANLVTQYRIYSRNAPADPSSRAPGAWTPVGAATAVGAPTGPVVLNCNPGEVVFLAAQLIYDSGFVSPIVSASKTGLSCSSTVADPPSKFKIIKKPGRVGSN